MVPATPVALRHSGDMVDWFRGRAGPLNLLLGHGSTVLDVENPENVEKDRATAAMAVSTDHADTLHSIRTLRVALPLVRALTPDRARGLGWLHDVAVAVATCKTDLLAPIDYNADTLISVAPSVKVIAEVNQQMQMVAATPVVANDYDLMGMVRIMAEAASAVERNFEEAFRRRVALMCQVPHKAAAVRRDAMHKLGGTVASLQGLPVLAACQDVYRVGLVLCGVQETHGDGDSSMTDAEVTPALSQDMLAKFDIHISCVTQPQEVIHKLGMTEARGGSNR